MMESHGRVSSAVRLLEMLRRALHNNDNEQYEKIFQQIEGVGDAAWDAALQKGFYVVRGWPQIDLALGGLRLPPRFA
jgi:hypothetical protein